MSNPRVIAVDDEPQILRFLKPALTAAGYDVVTAATGSEALRTISTQAPDIVLLDLGLPDMDGKDVIRKLRAWSSTPIIVLSARDRETEKIEALDLGADDYVNKPFSIGELMARMRAALRHAPDAIAASPRLQAGPIVIDLSAHTVSVFGHSVRLTPKEFELLAVLVRHAGRVMTHRQLLTAVWGPAHTDDLQYLRVFIGQLREKLGPLPEGCPELIRNEPGIGYRLQIEPL
jgi:two-component system, OmpR family, KDP operon response regulator KdpE